MNQGQEAFNLPGGVRNTNQGQEAFNHPGGVGNMNFPEGIFYTSDTSVTPAGTLRRVRSEIFNVLHPSRLNYTETGNEVIPGNNDINSNNQVASTSNSSNSSLIRRTSRIFRRNTTGNISEITEHEVIPENSNTTANQVTSTSNSGNSSVIQRVTNRLRRNSTNTNNTGIPSSMRTDSDTNHEPA
jgi:hypothetical protein